MGDDVYTGQSSTDALLSIKDVMSRVRCSRPTVYRMMARAQFPKPALRCGPRFTRWAARDVNAWLANPQGWIEANTKLVATTEVA